MYWVSLLEVGSGEENKTEERLLCTPCFSMDGATELVKSYLARVTPGSDYVVVIEAKQPDV